MSNNFSGSLGKSRSELINLVAFEITKNDQRWGYPREDMSDQTWLTVAIEELGEVADAGIDGNVAHTIDELIRVAAVAIDMADGLYRFGLNRSDSATYESWITHIMQVFGEVARSSLEKEPDRMISELKQLKGIVSQFILVVQEDRSPQSAKVK